MKACGKCGHEGHSWRLLRRRWWWGRFHLCEKAQKIGGTMELGKGGVFFSLWWHQKDNLVGSRETCRPVSHYIQVDPRHKQGTTTIWHWCHQVQRISVSNAKNSIPQENGLFSLVNRILTLELELMFLQQNPKLLIAIKDMKTLLRKYTLRTTKCKELITEWPDYIGVKRNVC